MITIDLQKITTRLYRKSDGYDEYYNILYCARAQYSKMAVA